MAEPRTYVIPMTGTVTVDSRKGTVKVEVDLLDLAHNLKYDYDHPYPDDQTKWDEETIHAAQGASMEHWSLSKQMSK